ncbi:hypothetical protein [Streptomyces sp. NPDC001678]|uniref:hypothetical protein n=1 Tax=Streptomyces sp. NPDC001678 TaxID=3364599 RepID=UPI00368466A0
MTGSPELSQRIQRARLAIARFGPIVNSDLSDGWIDTVSGEPGWLAWNELVPTAVDETKPMDAGEITRLLDSVSSLLDLFDEEPMGPDYYPFKAAELIELHCRMVTGDLPDDAPVGLDEWVRRFADHVDWQLDKSGVTAGGPQHFRSREAQLALRQQQLTGPDGPTLHEVMADAKSVGSLYVEALVTALA